MPVKDLAWNPGEDVFLAHYDDGQILLYNQEEPYPKMEFENLNVGVSKVVWMDNVSGDFLTSSAKVGALRLWNAA